MSMMLARGLEGVVGILDRPLQAKGDEDEVCLYSSYTERR